MDKDVRPTRYRMDWATSSQHVALEKLVNLLLGSSYSSPARDWDYRKAAGG